MTDYEDVTQILYQVGVDFIQKKSSNDELIIYEVPMFGLKIVWSLTKYEEKNNDWNILIVYPTDNAIKVREDIIWGLAKGGFFHYLRTNFSNTFNKMLAGREGEDWHRKIIEKRLELFGTKPKYNYFRELNEDGLNNSSMAVLSVEPSFYDAII